MGIFDHIALVVSDYARSKAFYEKALAPLGMAPVLTPQHVAFVARSRAEVDAFHRAALAAGGKNFGEPGLRPHYHPNYYGAYVLDPDGHNIEAVFHG
jgi:catechol 2,3-dioxygenase-like lactoylglutathione lyase family enzyme